LQIFSLHADDLHWLQRRGLFDNVKEKWPSRGANGAVSEPSTVVNFLTISCKSLIFGGCFRPQSSHCTYYQRLAQARHHLPILAQARHQTPRNQTPRRPDTICRFSTDVYPA